MKWEPGDGFNNFDGPVYIHTYKKGFLYHLDVQVNVPFTYQLYS